jgi:N-acetylglucosaminyl-diphospho-decaprenol L-rhamnosyltransferase
LPAVPSAMPSLTVVIVAHESVADLTRTLPLLAAELEAADELIVVDNDSHDALAEVLPQLAPLARLVRLDRNLGFAAGANAGVAEATGDLVVLLNPDAAVQPGWGRAIREPWEGRFAAWMGLVLLEDGTMINTSGGVIHFAGFGWAGQIDESSAAAPRSPTEVGFVSGACFAIPRDTWNELGGFPEHFFMYCEDVDLSLRLRLRGGVLGVEPRAVVLHDYNFEKGPYKWRLLERNRVATVIRTYPSVVLAVVFPVLLVAELATWAAAARGGWLRAKALSALDIIRALPALLSERRTIQATASAEPIAFALGFVPALDSPYFGGVGRQPIVRACLSVYWKLCLAILRAVS